MTNTTEVVENRKVEGPVKIMKTLRGASPSIEGPIKSWDMAVSLLKAADYQEVSSGVWERYAGKDLISDPQNPDEKPREVDLMYHAEIKSINAPS